MVIGRVVDRGTLMWGTAAARHRSGLTLTVHHVSGMFSWKTLHQAQVSGTFGSEPGAPSPLWSLAPTRRFQINTVVTSQVGVSTQTCVGRDQ